MGLKRILSKSFKHTILPIAVLLFFMLLLLSSYSLFVLKAYSNNWVSLLEGNSDPDIIVDIRTEFNNETNFFTKVKEDYISINPLSSQIVSLHYGFLYVPNFVTTAYFYFSNHTQTLTKSLYTLTVLSDSFFTLLGLDKNKLYFFTDFVTISDIATVVNISRTNTYGIYSANFTISSKFLNYNTFSSFLRYASWIPSTATIICSFSTVNDLLIRLGFYDDLVSSKNSLPLTADIWLEDFYMLKTDLFLARNPVKVATEDCINWKNKIESSIDFFFAYSLPLYTYSPNVIMPFQEEVNTLIDTQAPNILVGFVSTFVLLMIFSVLFSIYLNAFYSRNQHIFQLFYDRGISRKALIKAFYRIIIIHSVIIVLISYIGLIVGFTFLHLTYWHYAWINILIQQAIILTILAAVFLFWRRELTKNVLPVKKEVTPYQKLRILKYRVYAYLLLLSGIIAFLFFNSIIGIFNFNIWIVVLIILFMSFSIAYFLLFPKGIEYVSYIYALFSKETRELVNQLSKLFKIATKNSQSALRVILIFFVFYLSLFFAKDMGTYYDFQTKQLSAIHSYTIETSPQYVDILKDLFANQSSGFTIIYQLDFRSYFYSYSIFLLDTPKSFEQGIRLQAKFFVSNTTEEVFNILNSSDLYAIVSETYAHSSYLRINDLIAIPNYIFSNVSHSNTFKCVVSIAKFLPLISSNAFSNSWIAFRYNRTEYTIPPSTRCYFSFDSANYSSLKVVEQALKKQNILYNDLYECREQLGEFYNSFNRLLIILQVITEAFLVLGLVFLILPIFIDTLRGIKYFFIRGYSERKLLSHTRKWIIFLSVSTLLGAATFTFISILTFKLIFGSHLLYPLPIVLSYSSTFRILGEVSVFILIFTVLNTKKIKNGERRNE